MSLKEKRGSLFRITNIWKPAIFVVFVFLCYLALMVAETLGWVNISWVLSWSDL